MTRTAGVFFIKTIYSVLVSLFCLFANIPFPLIPIQITLVDACIEAYPSFLTIFESDTRRVTGSFLKKAIGNAWPFAFVVTSVIIFEALFSPFQGAQRQTVMYLLLIMTSMAAVIKSCIPFTRLRMFICITMVLGTFTALFLFSSLLKITAMTPMMMIYTSFVFVMGLVLLIFEWKFACLCYNRITCINKKKV